MLEFLVIFSAVIAISVVALALIVRLIEWLSPPGSYVRKENHNPPPPTDARPTKLPVRPPPKTVCRHCGKTP